MFEPREILDVTVHRTTLDAVIERLDLFVRSGRPHQVVTVNMDFLRIARSDAGFRETLNGADLSVADGVPVIWASRLLGAPLLERVTGVDIVERGAALAAAHGYSIFLLGAEPGVAAEAAAKLTHRFPGLRIAGAYAPPFGPFSDDEQARMLTMVRTARPDILFVAFGAPRQDIWIRQHLQSLGVPVCVGVGGAFNFIAGRLSRAPQWMQRSGMEWTYRLGQEPRRLWRRYLVGDLPIFLRIIGARALPRRRSLPTAPTALPPLMTRPDNTSAAGD